MFFIQVVRSRPGGRVQLSGGSSKMASAFSSIRARCPQKVRRRDLTMYESGGWLEMQQMWAFLTKSCQRMSRILRRHHWSTASIRCISALFSYPAFRSTEYGSTKSCTDRVWSRSLSVASASVDQDTALQLQCMEPGGLYGSQFNRVAALPPTQVHFVIPSHPSPYQFFSVPAHPRR